MRIFGEGSEKPGRFLVTVVNDVAVQVTDDIFHIHPPAPDVHLRGTSVRQGLDYLIIHPRISERFGIGSIAAHPDVERLVLYLVEILALGPGARAAGACGDGDRQRFQNMSHHISLFGAMPSHWFSITFSTFTRQATGVLGGSLLHRMVAIGITGGHYHHDEVARRTLRQRLLHALHQLFRHPALSAAYRGSTPPGRASAPACWYR